MMHALKLGRLRVDPYTMVGAVQAIAWRVANVRGGYVVTPNVDHVMLAEEDPRLVQAYDHAALSLADGAPILWASRWLGRPLPEKVSGSDLVVPLLERAHEKGWRVYLLGGAPGAAEAVAARLRRDWPDIQIVGVDAAAIESNGVGPRAYQAALRVQAAAPHLVLVGLGCPKQELWMAAHAKVVRGAVMVGVGASLDFLAGHVRRAPMWMQRRGLEWLYRLLQEPRRLWRRYLLRDTGFFFLVLRQALSGGRTA